MTCKTPRDALSYPTAPDIVVRSVQLVWSLRRYLEEIDELRSAAMSENTDMQELIDEEEVTHLVTTQRLHARRRARDLPTK